MKSSGFGKFLSIFSFLFVNVISWAQPAPVQPTPANGIGSPNPGTSGNPYEVSTLAELYWISQNSADWDKYYVQTANIDATGSGSWDGGLGWTPIGNTTTRFTGNYDGSGYIISNLGINRPSTTEVGLFGRIDGALIQRLGVTGSVVGRQNVGMLVGWSDDSKVQQCFSQGTVEAPKGRVGGLIGIAFGDTISDSYAQVDVTNLETDDFNLGGGFIGQIGFGLTVERCYSAGVVSDALGFLKSGFGSNSGGTATNCFYDSDISTTTSGAGTGLSTAAMRQQASFTNWDFQCEAANGTSDIWGIDEGNDYPVLSAFGFVQCLPPAVTVSGSAGANGDYPTLKDAFDAINANAQSAANDIEIEITGNTIETATAVLNEGNWNSLVIYPSATNLSISGDLAAPLIDLNGADRVTIDGRVNRTGSTKSLVIENENTSLTVGNSTIRFINGAQNNTIQYIILRGSAGSVYDNSTSGGTPSAQYGVMLFHTSSITGQGNSNNTIQFNDITNSGGNRPYLLIASNGSFNSDNINNLISENHFYDFELMRSGGAVRIGTRSGAWEIIGNHFFQPNTVTYKANPNVTSFISIESGTDYKINNNIFGGQLPNAGGGRFVILHATTNSAQTTFVRLNSEATAGNTEVKNNIFRNIDLTAHGSGSCTFISAFNRHPMLIEANEIGVQNASDNIILRSTSGHTFRGINIGISAFSASSTAPDTVRLNLIGGIEMPSNQGATFFGISSERSFATSWRARNLFISENIIGSPSQTNSIVQSNTSPQHTMTGVFINFQSVNPADRTVTIKNNTIANLTSMSSSTASVTEGIYAEDVVNLFIQDNEIMGLSSASLRTQKNPNVWTNRPAIIGISDMSQSFSSISQTQSVITGNVLRNFTLTGTNAPGQILGINNASQDKGALIQIERNLIHSFTINSPGANAEITGIRIGDNSVNATTNPPVVANNIIRLGGDNDYIVAGIRQSNHHGNIYFNTVYIDGTLGSGSAQSYCIHTEGGATNATRNIQNNILENHRSTTGGSSLHYALYMDSFTERTNTNLNFNNYRSTGDGGVLAYYNSTDQTQADFESPDWNANSASADPQFQNAGGVAPADYQTSVNLPGTPIAGISEDFFGSFRSLTSPNKGAYEATGPVLISFSTGADGIYSTLKDAFDALNANPTQTGNAIQIRINQSTNETATAVLNAGDWESVRIFPTATGLSVSATINSNALIRLNGADSVIIDGRVNMTGDSLALLLENLSTSSNNNTSTILFINGAQNNIFRYCSIRGQSASVTGGTIFFSTSSSGPNSGNIFERNSISGRTYAVVYSIGSNATNNNANNTFLNNRFFDFLRPSFTTYGFRINTWSADFNIIGNHFYETSTFVPTSTGEYVIIASVWGSAPNRFIVRDNYIGGSAPFAAGAPLTKASSTSNRFGAIYSDAGTDSEISGNVITNIDWTNSAGATINLIEVWRGLNTLVGGIGKGNIIGSATNPNALRFTNNGTVRGIFLRSDAAASGAGRSASHNTIAGIRVETTVATTLGNLIAIHHESTAGNIDSNIIGTSDAPLRCEGAATSANQQIIGIFSGDAAGGQTPVQISGNTISYLYNQITNTAVGVGKTYGIFTVNTSSGYRILGNTVHNLYIANGNNQEFHTQLFTANQKQNAAAPSLIGICLIADGSSQHQVSRNTVYNLNQTLSSFSGTVYGIYFGSGSNANNLINGNFVHSLNTEPTAVGAKIRAIAIRTGGDFSVNYTASNNLVVLDNNLPVEVGGILDYSSSTGTRRMFNNTIYIAGAPASGTHNSFGILNQFANGTRNYQNNIVVNARSGNGNHYAHFIEYAAFGNNTVHILNSNVYYTPGTNGIVGRINNTDYTTLADWRTISGKEQLSKSSDPGFANPGGLQILDYLPSDVTLVSSGVGITTDILGAARVNNSRGAIEYATVPPVTVNATAGLASADYTTFKAAIDAINDGTHEGVINVEVNASVQEANASILYQSGYNGTANYTAVRIYPTSSDVVLLGNLSATMFQLNGADSVTIDGRINRSGTGRNLSFVNINQFHGALRLLNGCENNIIRNAIFEGQADAGDNTRRGVVMLSVSNAGPNQNNVFLNNGITSTAGSLRAIAAFDANGSASPNNNSNNSIVDNDFYNHFRTNATTFGVRIGANCDGFVIIGNSFYETGVFSTTTNNANVTGIDIDNTSGLDYTIRGNFIGGSATQCGGSPFTYTNTNASTFIGIRLNVNANSTSEIDSNTISNISWTNTTGSWVGIRRQAGRAYIGQNRGNRIGDLSANSITVTAGGSSSAVYGIEIQSANEVVVNNSIIGGITGNATGTNRLVVAGIGNNNATLGTVTVDSNLIGSSAAPLINTTQVSTATVSGIDLGFGGTRTVRGNRVEGLSSTNAAFTGIVQGIKTPAGVVSENFVTGLSADVGSSGVTTIGIRLNSTASATAEVHNNIVSLNGNADANWRGISDEISVNRQYLHNTVYMSGSPTGSAFSAALFASSPSGIREYRNNILANARSGGGNHYGTYFGHSSTTDLTLEFNAYWPTGTNAHIGFFGGTPYASISDWQGAVGADFLSKTSDPGFANAGGSSPLDYLPSSTSLAGSLSAITTDFSGAARTYNAIGALDYSLPSPITVNASAGTPTATYNSLHDAFEAINDGTHQGNIDIELSNGVFESNQAVLYESGYNGTSLYNSVDIYPVSPDVRIVGAFTSGAVLVLDGADTVTIDGRVNRSGSTRSMEIINSAVTNNAGVSTVVLRNGAQDNILRYLGIKGAMSRVNLTTIADNTGVVAFLGTNNSTPNMNNVVEHSSISGISLANRPTAGLLSAGSSSFRNRDNVVRFNEFKNLFNPNSSLGYHILIADNNTAWTLEGNHFYEEAPLSPSSPSSTTYSFIWLQPHLVGDNFIVKDNFMGGTEPSASGSPLVKNATNNSSFYGIYASLRASTGVDAAIESEFTGNVIRNIHWANSTYAPFAAIYSQRGKVKIGSAGNANIVGDTTVTNSIVISCGNAMDTEHYGIRASNIAENNVYIDISHNVISGISLNNTNPISGANFYAIHCDHMARIEYNRIGSELPASISTNSASTSNSQHLYGIWNAPVSNAISQVNHNMVRNLVNGTTHPTFGGYTVGIYALAHACSVDSNEVYNLSTGNARATRNIVIHNGAIINQPTLVGIIALQGSGATSLQFNKVYNLHQVNTSYPGAIAGIMALAIGSNASADPRRINRNIVTNLTVAGSGSNATIYGLWNGNIFSQKSYNVFNNLVSIGGNTGAEVIAYYDSISNNSFNQGFVYFNSFYAHGNQVIGNFNSHAAYFAIDHPLNVRNNIFSNQRVTSGGNGNNYAVNFRYSNGAQLMLDYNNYAVNAAGGIKALVGSSDINTLPVFTGKDGSSISDNPQFQTSVIPDYKLFYPVVPFAGVEIAGINDYLGTVRNNPPTIGALESLTWVGTADTDYDNPANWRGGVIPGPDDVVTFDLNPVNDLILDQNRTMRQINNGNSTYVVRLNGFELTLTGNLVFSNGAFLEGITPNSRLILSGTGPQPIPTGAFEFGSVYNLTVRNPHGISLQSDTLEILDEIRIDSGMVILNNALLLTGNIAGTLNDTNYFQTLGSGRLGSVLTDGSSFTFPVGNSTYNPLTVTNNTGLTDTFAVQVRDGVLDAATAGPIVNDPRVDRIWGIRKYSPNGGAGIDFVFQWDTTHQVGPITDFYLNYFDGNNWMIPTVGGRTVDTSTAERKLIITGYTGTFSDFSIGGDPVDPLPVELIAFNGVCSNMEHVLNWTTASEINNFRFVIERSEDGVVFQPVGEQSGAGTTAELNTYAFRTSAPSRNEYYYRLIQEDFDGTFKVYPSLALSCKGDIAYGLAANVFPNPSAGNSSLQISSSRARKVWVQISDAMGRPVHTKELNISEGTNLFGLPGATLSAGVYTISLRSEGETRTLKWVRN